MVLTCNIAFAQNGQASGVKPSERVIPANAPRVWGDVKPDSIGIDTLAREGRKLRLRKTYLLAAFQEGIHKVVPEVVYADKNIIDTLRGEDTLRLFVNTFQIDSTSHSVFDIKPQRTLKFKVGEISGYLTWSVITLIVVVLLLFVAKRILEHYGKRFSDIFHPAPPLPPHEIALRDLRQLHGERLWQEGKHKLYYSTLTDILRAYIAGVWGVGALEMTSDEILEAMREVDIPQKQSMDLSDILRSADLVKFAKAMPEAEENEAAYSAAWEFVNQTMPQPEQEQEEN